MEWILWALNEGFFMALMKIGQGIVGRQSPTLWHIILATGITGAVMMIAGFLIVIRQRKPVYVPDGYLMGSLASGLVMFGATFCAFAALRAGADMGANTFVGNALVILPTTFIGRWSFSERVGVRQWMGVALGLAGAVCVTVPALGKGGEHVWIAWSLGTLAFATLMRVIPKQIAKWGDARALPPLHPGQMLFWGGASMMLCMLLGFAGGEDVRRDVLAPTLIGIIIAVGLCNVVWWWSRLRAFQARAPIAIKDLPSLPIYLATASVAGTLFFGDEMGVIKVIGLLMFLPAFFLAEEQAWPHCTRFLVRYRWWNWLLRFAGKPTPPVSVRAGF